VFIVVVYFVIDSVQKLFGYTLIYKSIFPKYVCSFQVFPMEMMHHLYYKLATVILRRPNKTKTCLKYLWTSGIISAEVGKTAHTM